VQLLPLPLTLCSEGKHAMQATHVTHKLRTIAHLKGLQTCLEQWTNTSSSAAITFRRRISKNWTQMRRKKEETPGLQIRRVTLLTSFTPLYVSDIVSLLLSFTYTHSLFLKVLRLTFFRLYLFILLGFCNHCNLTCFLSLIILNTFQQTAVYVVSVHNDLDTLWLKHFKMYWCPHHHPNLL
jgi:hypothetical protein